MSEPYPLYGVHGENELLYGPGWLVLTRGIWADPSDHSGEDFRRFPHRKIVRLNYNYFPHGTIPTPSLYENFAQRVANFVGASQGCSRWIIGNEPNIEQERPAGQPILPEMYVRCFNLCRAAIRSLAGHSGDQVLLAPIAPWNVDTKYAGNESGDWIRYFEDVQFLLPAGGCDGFAFHTYTRAQTPESVSSFDRMDPPFQEYHNGFYTFTDWMGYTVARFQGLPCYITEFCVAGVPWKDINNSTVQQAYYEIDVWNRTRVNRPISCLTMYRWSTDQWRFDDKPNVQADFHAAVEKGYTVPPNDIPEPPEETMLQNPSFEEDWYNQTPDGILVLPDYWRAEYQEGNNPYKRPEIKPNQEFVTDGRYSIRAFPPAHSRGFYGIYQDVDVEQGQWYRFSADVRTESSPPGKLGAFVGIQPWGGSIFHRQMIWGEEIVNTHGWTRIEVVAQAFGGRIRVAMGADNEYPTANNTTWWDNASLEVWECDGGGTEPPVEPPEPGECNFDLDAIREVVREELSVREPVRWPR